MTVEKQYVNHFKSEFVSDTNENGGRIGWVPVIFGTKQNILPKIKNSELTSGITKQRKTGYRFSPPDDEPGSNVLYFLQVPSNSQDIINIGKGTDTNTQGDWTTYPPIFTGTGSLNTALTGGETSVSILMEDNLAEFIPGGFLHLTDRVLLSQTCKVSTNDASKPNIGDTLQATGTEGVPGTWYKTTPASPETYTFPKGCYLGNNKVFTIISASRQDILKIRDYTYTDDVIATGDGVTSTPVLTDLSGAIQSGTTMGLMTHWQYLPVVKATCGAVERTVNIAANGACSGYCSAGQLNMATGVWTTNITFSTPPDDGTDVTITYTAKPYIYSGNVATVHLNDPVPNVYDTDTTFAGGCIGDEDTEIKAKTDGITVTSVAGTYNSGTYPLILYSDGAETDSFTLTFSTSTAFTGAGIKSGSLGSGTITANFQPTNPQTGQPLFKLDYRGFSGSFQAGNKLMFTTYASALNIIWREKVPAGASPVKYNLVLGELYWE